MLLLYLNFVAYTFILYYYTYGSHFLSMRACYIEVVSIICKLFYTGKVMCGAQM